jgi:hypothetical protein
LKPGEKGEVVEVKRAEKNALQRLLAMGVVPGSILKVEFASPAIWLCNPEPSRQGFAVSKKHKSYDPLFSGLGSLFSM